MWRTYQEEARLISDDPAWEGAELHIDLDGAGTGGVELSSTNNTGGSGYPIVIQVDGSAIDYQNRFF